LAGRGSREKDLESGRIVRRVQDTYLYPEETILVLGQELAVLVIICAIVVEP
jgi:hypothetical protein